MTDTWINWTAYTPFQIFLFGGGCFLWVIVYAIYLYQLVKFRFVELPLLGACADIGWEFTWSWLLKTNMGMLFQLTYRIWFVVDIPIFFLILKYGSDEVQDPGVKRYYIPVMLGTAAAWALGSYFLSTSGYETPIGANAAYLDNVVLSASYIAVMLGRRSVRRYSLAAAWLKMLGTGMNTVFMNVYPPFAENHFLHFISITASSLDLLYIYVLTKRMREERAADATAAPAAA